MNIPEKFYKANIPHPTAQTVGQLKAILSELPDSLPVRGPFDDAVKLIVFNIRDEDVHLQIQETDED